MFLLVNNLNVVHRQVQKIEHWKNYNKGFPNHSTLINYVLSQYIVIIICFFFICANYVTFAVASVIIYYYVNDLFDGIN